MMKKEVMIKLKGDARKENKTIVLTSGLHSEGQVTIQSPVSISDSDWSCKFTGDTGGTHMISDIQFSRER